MDNINVDLLVNAQGLSCPMPIVKLKKGMGQIEAGQVLELQATDKGAVTDIKAWTDSTGHQYLGNVEEDGVYKFYIRKASSDEVMTKKHQVVTSNEDLMKKLADKEDIQVVDVREEAEYAFAHIPNAVSIPLGELENKLSSLSKDKEVYVVCRTGHRSDLAAQMLSSNGFQKVINVLPGMSNWTGIVEGIQ